MRSETVSPDVSRRASRLVKNRAPKISIERLSSSTGTPQRFSGRGGEGGGGGMTERQKDGKGGIAVARQRGEGGTRGGPGQQVGNFQAQLNSNKLGDASRQWERTNERTGVSLSQLPVRFVRCQFLDKNKVKSPGKKGGDIGATGETDTRRGSVRI